MSDMIINIPGNPIKVEPASPSEPDIAKILSIIKNAEL